MMGANQVQLQEILTILHLEHNGANIYQLDAMVRALNVHDQRNRKYKDQWKGSGWMGAVFDIQKKAQRLFRQFWGDDPTEGSDEDDAVDLINFACFFLRGRADDNKWGTWL